MFCVIVCPAVGFRVIDNELFGLGRIRLLFMAVGLFLC